MPPSSSTFAAFELRENYLREMELGGDEEDSDIRERRSVFEDALENDGHDDE